MTRRARVVRSVLMAACLAAAGAPAADAGVWYHDGPAGRVRLAGTWGFRLDRHDRGLRRHWGSPAVRLTLRHVTVPYVWNAGVRDSTARGGVAWYVRRFTVPAGAPPLWRVRFGSTHHLAMAWVDGRLVGRHRGGFLPWETAVLRLAPGPHELRVRTDNRLSRAIVKTGGYAWWNWGGISREVELRPVHDVDLLDVAVLPRNVSAAAATLDVTARAVNADAVAHRVRILAAGAGQTTATAAVTLAPGASMPVALRLPVASPRLWSPGNAYLYPVHLRTESDGVAAPAYDTHVGIRTITVVRGRLLLNGRRLLVRGVSLHEQRRGRGDALRPGNWRRTLARLRGLGVNATRAQYPLAPGFVESLDRAGILLWADAPFGWVRNRQLADRRSRRLMLDYVAQTVRAQEQHASIWAWGVGNELAAHESTGRTVRRYVSAAAALVRGLDPTRLVAVTAQAGRIDAPARPWSAVDVLGANAYLGWYGERRMPASAHLRRDLRALVRRAHHLYPSKALILSEFGAEGAARGPSTRRGTYGYQARLLGSVLREAGRNAALDGELVWALQDFAVRPGWRGGNRYRARPPYSLKGLLTLDGRRKPAYAVVRRELRRLAARAGS